MTFCFIWKNSPRIVHGFLCAAGIAWLLAPRAIGADEETNPPAAARWQIVGHARVALDGFSDDVRVVRMPDGRERFLVRAVGGGEPQLLDDAELVALLKSQASRRTWLHHVFQASGWTGFVWVAVGLGGQVLFAGRMVLQWLVSEKHKRSVVPVAFWWVSLAGATLLLAYFVWRRDLVGVLGQSMGWVIYVRNLILIYRAR